MNWHPTLAIWQQAFQSRRRAKSIGINNAPVDVSVLQVLGCVTKICIRKNETNAFGSFNMKPLFLEICVISHRSEQPGAAVYVSLNDSNLCSRLHRIILSSSGDTEETLRPSLHVIDSLFGNELKR